MYPQYENLNLNKYETLFGYYTLGFIQHHRPDLFIIDIRLKNEPCDYSHDLINYDWLEPKIQQGLAQGRSVIIIPDDEHVMFTVNAQLTKILNNYKNDPVYWITLADHLGQKTYYRTAHQFQIKILELPWWTLNECLTYYCVADTVKNFAPKNQGYNFFCLIGNNSSGPHKINLARELRKKRLDSYGLITVNKNYSFPDDLLEFCQVNQEEIYKQTDPNYTMIARQVNINGVWVSKNVENYLHLDQKYHHIPLAINSETTLCDFISTEKSIWPILLGKLFLIYGRPGSMAWIQRFYDVDITRFADITYDAIKLKGYDSGLDYHNIRLNTMIVGNQNLIKYAEPIYQQLQPELELARWTLGKNLYKFFISQLESIP